MRSSRPPFMRSAMVDAVTATAYGTLTSSQFLGGCLTRMGVQGLPFALAVSLQHLGMALQPLAAPLVQRSDRKWLCVAGAAVSRLAWLGVAAATLWLQPGPALLAILAALTLGNAFAAYSSNAWLTWIADLVPAEERPAFFAKRNAIVSVTTMAVVMAGGWYVDWHGGEQAYRHIFLAAIVFGALSLWALQLQPEAPPATSGVSSRGLDYLMLPLRDARFNRLLLFKMSWSFVVGIAAPLWVPQMLTVLGMTQSQISTYNLFALLGTVLFSGAFARLAGRIGNRPALALAAAGIATNPIWWCLSTRGFFTPCWFEGFWSGSMWAGFNLFILNLAIELAPNALRPIYLAVFNASEGIAFFAGGLAGGLLAELTSGFSWHFGLVHLGPYHPVFLLSVAGRVLSIGLLRAVVDPGAMGVRDAMALLFRRPASWLERVFRPAEVEEPEQRKAA